MCAFCRVAASSNQADQLTAIINKNGFPSNPSFWTVSQHGYDPNGMRVVSQFACGTSHNIYGAGGKLMWQVYDAAVPFLRSKSAPARAKSCVSSPMNRRYVYLDGQVIAQVETKADNSTQTTYRHNDLLGSARAITDAAGSLVTTTIYGPFGEPVPGTQVRGTGYTGHQMEDYDLTYMGARYYDQLSGRFLSIDPVRVNSNTGGNWNRYAYAGNSPYKFVDPDGRAFFLVVPVVEAILIGSGVSIIGEASTQVLLEGKGIAELDATAIQVAGASGAVLGPVAGKMGSLAYRGSIGPTKAIFGTGLTAGVVSAGSTYVESTLKGEKTSAGKMAVSGIFGTLGGIIAGTVGSKAALNFAKASEKGGLAAYSASLSYALQYGANGYVQGTRAAGSSAAASASAMSTVSATLTDSTLTTGQKKAEELIDDKE